ncbi:hypothetical protein Ancab_036142 [Ancistrocladus abbreviatus]
MRVYPHINPNQDLFTCRYKSNSSVFLVFCVLDACFLNGNHNLFVPISFTFGQCNSADLRMGIHRGVKKTEKTANRIGPNQIGGPVQSNAAARSVQRSAFINTQQKRSSLSEPSFPEGKAAEAEASSNRPHSESQQLQVSLTPWASSALSPTVESPVCSVVPQSLSKSPFAAVAILLPPAYHHLPPASSPLFNFVQVVFFVFSPSLVGSSLAKTITLEDFVKLLVSGSSTLLQLLNNFIVEVLSSEKAMLLFRIENIHNSIPLEIIQALLKLFDENKPAATAKQEVGRSQDQEPRPVFEDKIQTGTQNLGLLLRQLDAIFSASAVFLRTIRACSALLPRASFICAAAIGNLHVLLLPLFISEAFFILGQHVLESMAIYVGHLVAVVQFLSNESEKQDNKLDTNSWIPSNEIEKELYQMGHDFFF